MTCGPTDGPTDGRTDIPSYRDARTHLKTNRIACRQQRIMTKFSTSCQVYVWDVFEKVKNHIETAAASVAPHVHGQRAGPAELQIAQQCLCRAVSRIAAMTTIGKDGKFQQLMCIGAR